MLEGDQVTARHALLAQDPGKLQIALEQARSEEAVALARLQGSGSRAACSGDRQGESATCFLQSRARHRPSTSLPGSGH